MFWDTSEYIFYVKTRNGNSFLSLSEKDTKHYGKYATFDCRHLSKAFFSLTNITSIDISGIMQSVSDEVKYPLSTCSESFWSNFWQANNLISHWYNIKMLVECLMQTLHTQYRRDNHKRLHWRFSCHLRQVYVS